MFDVFYISDGKLFKAANGAGKRIACGAVDSYRQTIMEINRKKEWKTQGAGANFMGVAMPRIEERDINVSVEAIVTTSDERLIYAATLETDCAIYTKNLKNPDDVDIYITRLVNTRIYHMDYDPADKLIVVSASDGYIEKHLALCGEEKANYRMITEGDCVDITPSFSRKDNKMIYFSSAGFYVDKKKGAIYSNYAICSFDLILNELNDVFSDEKYDFIYPRQMADGKLYCIRRPRQQSGNNGISLLDIVLAPFRFLRAVFGWANFFSQRYTGESLTKGKSGPNPAKNMEKSEREVFIEDNLINAEKTFKENSLAGEKYPGIAPKNWELVSLGTDGSVEVIKRGVLNYTFDSNGLLIYSNGKYILRQQPDGDEIISEAGVAKSLCIAENKS